MPGQRTTGEVEDFQRANDPLQIARAEYGRDAASTRRSHRCNDATPRRSAIAASLIPQPFILSQDRERGPGSGTIVEAGSADDKRRTPALVDIADEDCRILAYCAADTRPLDRRCRSGDANPTTLVERHFIRADVESSIHRGRIAVDDLAV